MSAKKPVFEAPVRGLEMPGNIARYAALLAHEIASAIPGGPGPMTKGTIKIDLSLIVDMDEARIMANATKGVVVNAIDKA